MEELLLALILGSTALTALVGDRVSWSWREQASNLPAVTLSKISGGPLYADEGEVDLDEVRVQIDCWALTMTTATAVARAVREQISAHFDETFLYVTLDATRDLREGGANQTDYEYRVSMDFIVLSRKV